MKILIDTHLFLWMLSCPDKLNEKRRYLLESPSNEIFLSAMSITELMIKSSIGKLEINFDTVLLDPISPYYFSLLFLLTISPYYFSFFLIFKTVY